MLSENWLFWSIPLAIGGFFLLKKIIANLVRIIRLSLLQQVPLRYEAKVRFNEKGKVLMHIEGPRFTTAFRGLSYELYDINSNQHVKMRRNLMPMQSSGISSVRTLHRVLHITRQGEYVLRIHGLQGNKDYKNCSIVFTRPYGLAVFLHILGILFAGGCLIFGIIMSGIYLSHT